MKIAELPSKLRSTHNRQTVDKLIQIVKDKIKGALSHHNQISSQNLLLTALYLAKDFLPIKLSIQLELGQLETCARKILSNLKSSPISQVEVGVVAKLKNSQNRPLKSIRSHLDG